MNDGNFDDETLLATPPEEVVPLGTEERLARLAKRVGSLIGGVLTVAVIVWCNPFVGSESSHAYSDSILTGGSSWRFNFGSETVFARPGQSIELTCEATVEQGELTVNVRRNSLWPRPLGEARLYSLRITESGTTRHSVPIRESDLYHIDINPWREAGRYDIDYEVSWRVR